MGLEQCDGGRPGGGTFCRRDQSSVHQREVSWDFVRAGSECHAREPLDWGGRRPFFFEGSSHLPAVLPPAAPEEGYRCNIEGVVDDLQLPGPSSPRSPQSLCRYTGATAEVYREHPAGKPWSVSQKMEVVNFALPIPGWSQILGWRLVTFEKIPHPSENFNSRCHIWKEIPFKNPALLVSMLNFGGCI